MSTVALAVTRPPTARSSGTVIETARQFSESGAIVSPGPMIENCPPVAVEAIMFVVIIASVGTETARIRPMTLLGSLIASSFVGSSGTSVRTVTSSASTGLRAGIARFATTTDTF